MFWAIVFVTHQMGVCIFRCTAMVARNIVVANGLGMLVMLCCILLDGFVIIKRYIHPWVVWYAAALSDLWHPFVLYAAAVFDAMPFCCLCCYACPLGFCSLCLHTVAGHAVLHGFVIIKRYIHPWVIWLASVCLLMCCMTMIHLACFQS